MSTLQPSFWQRHRYSIYLLSLLLLLLGQMPLPDGSLLLQQVLVLQNLVVSFVLLETKKVGRRIFVAVIGVMAVGAYSGSLFAEGTGWWPLLSYSLFLSYFLAAVWVVFMEIFRARHVTLQILVAAFCGFILLGFLGSFSFAAIDMIWPDSFHNVGSGPEKMDNLKYFSFVTLLTIGYGDMYPVGAAAQKACVLLGLVGQFYLTIVLAILIGKFLSPPSAGTGDGDADAA